MAINYVVVTTPSGEQVIQYEQDGILYTIPEDPTNADYQAYLESLQQ